ncbi:MAG: 3-octaprenyl-4-hydroxybenzoate carboxy-lyase, partial [Armatimonadaceae bacterium]
RELGTSVPVGLRLPDGFTSAKVALPGVLAVKAPPFQVPGSKFQVETRPEYDPDLLRFCEALGTWNLELGTFPLVVLVDDAEFASRTPNNFLWVTFTRSNPATDVLGVNGRTWRKHFGCTGPLVIDARLKPHMAPPLDEDPAVTKRVDDLAARGGPLHGLLG